MIIKEDNKRAITEAINNLRDGNVISFATDTVYGVACDASNDDAVKKLFKLKKRDKTKPIAIFVSDINIADKIVKIDKKSMLIAKKLMPGAITLVLDKKSDSEFFISELLNTNHTSLGVRIPKHEFSLKLLKKFTGILAVTSANISDMPCANNAHEVDKYFGDEISLIIDGGICNGKVSTIIRVDGDENIEIIRKGFVSEEAIYESWN